MSEVVKLRKVDIDFERMMIHVRPGKGDYFKSNYSNISFKLLSPMLLIKFMGYYDFLHN